MLSLSEERVLSDKKVLSTEQAVVSLNSTTFKARGTIESQSSLALQIKVK